MSIVSQDRMDIFKTKKCFRNLLKISVIGIFVKSSLSYSPLGALKSVWGTLNFVSRLKLNSTLHSFNSFIAFARLPFVDDKLSYRVKYVEWAKDSYVHVKFVFEYDFLRWCCLFTVYCCLLLAFLLGVSWFCAILLPFLTPFVRKSRICWDVWASLFSSFCQ
jgi:hypothetical protein